MAYLAIARDGPTVTSLNGPKKFAMGCDVHLEGTRRTFINRPHPHGVVTNVGPTALCERRLRCAKFHSARARSPSSRHARAPLHLLGEKQRMPSDATTASAHTLRTNTRNSKVTCLSGRIWRFPCIATNCMYDVTNRCKVTGESGNWHGGGQAVPRKMSRWHLTRSRSAWAPRKLCARAA